MEATDIEAIMNRIRETWESTRTQPTTQQPQRHCNREVWLAKWVGLKVTHLKLSRLETGIFEFCRDYAKSPARGRRMLIHGPNGCGKTHAAKAISRWASRVAIELPLAMGDMGARLAESVYWNWPAFVRSLYGKWDRTNELVEKELVILDDIGAEHDPSKFGSAELYFILESRERKWTVLTTNVHPNEWAKKFDQRIASRFLRNCTVVDLEGVPDFRTKNTNQIDTKQPKTA